ncbi:MAG: alkaline phosphatase family protein [archaeon]
MRWLLIVLLIAGCGGEKLADNNVLIIGIDGADPRLMQHLMDSGKLPNFAKLAEAGHFSELATVNPPQSPVVWSAIATGSNPGETGVFDFIMRDAETYLPKLSISQQDRGGYINPVKAEPFWKAASDAGVPATVIRWPLSFPAERINGRMLSGLGVPDIQGFMNSYHFYATEAASGEGAEKVILVELKDGMIETAVKGPFIKSGQVEAPLQITVKKDGAILSLDKEYAVVLGGWSDWIRIRFAAGALKNVYGVAKVHLESVEPFRMYMTSVMIDPENPVVKLSYPEGYAGELAQAIGMYYTLGMPEDTKALEEGRISEEVFLQQVAEIEEERRRMFWHEFEGFSGVYAFVFDASDRLMHTFWDEDLFSGGEVPAEIEDYFVGFDGFLGEVLERIDDKTRLLIISDHGFTSFKRAVTINRWLVDNGYMVLKQEPQDSGDLFKYVDWERTRAYSLGFSSIYVNLKGCEGKGIVEDREALVDEIVGNLKGLRDGNRSVITELYKREDIYSGKYLEDAPDIIIGFEPGYRMSWQNAVGGLTDEVITNNNKKWAADHIVDARHVPGVVFANFELKENMTVMDIGPLILELGGAD